MRRAQTIAQLRNSQHELQRKVIVLERWLEWCAPNLTTDAKQHPYGVRLLEYVEKKLPRQEWDLKI